MLPDSLNDSHELSNAADMIRTVSGSDWRSAKDAAETNGTMLGHMAHLFRTFARAQEQVRNRSHCGGALT
jgi:hypothetical protein